MLLKKNILIAAEFGDSKDIRMTCNIYPDPMQKCDFACHVQVREGEDRFFFLQHTSHFLLQAGALKHAFASIIGVFNKYIDTSQRFDLQIGMKNSDEKIDL